MRRVAVVWALIVFLAASGGRVSPLIAQHTASASRLSTPSPVSTPTPPAPTYGLLLSAGSLELIRPDATIAAATPVAAPSVQSCTAGQDAAVLQPPVSGSNSTVYFRDGDTKLRSLSPSGQTADVTTVPGGPTTVSFFSVSPDDQRIVVIVEDLSGATSIVLRLYVEDLVGHTHHADIYTTTTPKGTDGRTLWPMGWHEGALVLAVMRACTTQPTELDPIEWHVSNASTADRIVTIRQFGCILSHAPSPAGVACVSTAGNAGITTLDDWSGKAVGTTDPGSPDVYSQSGLSPNGQRFFWIAGGSQPLTIVREIGLGGNLLSRYRACGWIDNDHLLATDAVINIGNFDFSQHVGSNAGVTPLPAAGVCAGRLPGGL